MAGVFSKHEHSLEQAHLHPLVFTIECKDKEDYCLILEPGTIHFNEVVKALFSRIVIYNLYKKGYNRSITLLGGGFLATYEYVGALYSAEFSKKPRWLSLTILQLLLRCRALNLLLNYY